MRFGRVSGLAAGAVITVCLVLMLSPLAGHAFPPATQGVVVVPTELCACVGQATAAGSAPADFRGHGPPSTGTYDEQIGLTFTQSFTSMEYNVTAVEQNDPNLGDGPAYLLDGLSNTGYWYQVGVSWDWSPGQVPGEGFDMNYEVFDTSGNSVFPANGQGGLASFSGPVNDGDVILLDLYFTNSTQSVVMVAEDPDTGAHASESYSDMGSTYFLGLPNAVANDNGFFTGLMTEWYHGSPYYADESEVIYNSRFALSSAWMWMDEFNANTFQGVFATNTSAPVSYGDPTKLQEFAFNGTTEYSDAIEFVTGALTNSTLSSTSIPLAFSYSVLDGGSGYAPPTLSYISNGTSHSVPLSGLPTVYIADIETTWSVSETLVGSTASERWATDQTTSGTANSSDTVSFVFYNQDRVTFDFTVTGGGTGFSPPSVTYESFGSSSTTPVKTAVWVDAGSGYQFTNPLSGSTSTERWFASPDGSIGSSNEVTVAYHLQYLVTFVISFKNTEIFPGLSLRSTSAGLPYSTTVVSGTNREWLDSGSSYTIPQSYSLEPGQRLTTNGTATGEVSANQTLALVYQHQFYLEVAMNVPGGGAVSPESGWYDSGSDVELVASAAQGWQFEGWEGAGSDSVSGSNSSLSLTVGPGAPANETADFYPGVMVEATGPVSVSYSDGSTAGTVPAGATAEVYVPPSSTLTLTASSVPFLTSFNGWSGASDSKGGSTTLAVNGPATVASDSGYNFAGIVALVLVVSAISAGVAFAVTRRPSALQSTVGTTDESGKPPEG